jgi:hypothetical protein
MQNYDVFLCHNSLEKPAVREVYEVLRNQRGLAAFLDESQLVGGEQWEKHIATALAGSRTLAVMLGGHGWGKYQLEGELVPALARRAQDATFRVIPVLMRGFDERMLVDRRDVEELFVKTMWVDLREGVDDIRMRMLMAAIRGESAFPEGRPELTVARVRFDAVRWDVTRRDASMLYSGGLLNEAAALVAAEGERVPALTHEFIAHGRAHQDERIGLQLASHAGALVGDADKIDLAVALATEATRRFSTPEALDVLRNARTRLPRTIANVPLPTKLAAIAAGANEVVFGCEGGELVVWAETKTTALPRQHTGCVTALTYDLQERWFASGGEDGVIHVWNACTHEPMASLQLGERVSGRDMSNLTRAEQARGPVYPLLCLAGDDVDDFLHRRMEMKGVTFARRHRDPHELELLCRCQAGARQPVVRAPRRGLDDGFGCRHKAEWMGTRHGRRIVPFAGVGPPAVSHLDNPLPAIASAPQHRARFGNVGLVFRSSRRRCYDARPCSHVAPSSPAASCYPSLTPSPPARRRQRCPTP